MRFKASIRNIVTFTRLTASLNSLGKDVWLQLNNDQLRFTVVPEQGSQVWATAFSPLKTEKELKDTIFETYTLQSASANNVINLRVPLAHLNRALRSALPATSASIRLTKKDNIPLLSLTIVTSSLSSALRAPPTSIPTTTTTTFTDPTPPSSPPNPANASASPPPPPPADAPPLPSTDRETTITQDIPIIVLPATEISHIHEPICPQPDVHIMLPPLSHLKNISDRFVRLAASSSSSSSSTSSYPSAARLRIAATPTGMLRIGVAANPALKIASTWSGLQNPELDPSQIEGGDEGVRTHASTVAREEADRRAREARERGGVAEESWSEVVVEGRDWGRVLGVGRMGGRVIACFCRGVGLVLYVYLEEEGEEGGGGSVLTFYIASYVE